MFRKPVENNHHFSDGNVTELYTSVFFKWHHLHFSASLLCLLTRHCMSFCILLYMSFTYIIKLFHSLHLILVSVVFVIHPMCQIYSSVFGAQKVYKNIDKEQFGTIKDFGLVGTTTTEN